MAGKLLSIIALLTILSTAVYGQAWGPWSTSPDSPAILTTADRQLSSPKKEHSEVSGVAGTPFVWLVKLYQKYVSPVDGDRCPMYPTCSQYSLQAMHKHGPFIGVIMTADRLMHETDERDFAPARKIGNRYRFIDPVENNDFWWYKK